MPRLFDLIPMEDDKANQNTPQSIEIDEKTTVKHVEGSSDSKAQDFGYDSWIDYYRKHMKIPCCYLDCHNDAEFGAHVKIKGYGERWWIVPVCPRHNPPTNESFKVKANTIAVRHPKKQN
ncbi:hypothetical protein [Helicobacter ailurogastricus]|uniref:hypothetical protein n=1 Tax=Helicobacter ailurogastricus TaxID=1578720 RepID=UPI00244D8BF6|nr:hypothetical protein [Helicobacter ailurogastricus]GMB90837.1 hypothetical protein NHP190009_00020 [Helicobacter ailurogastricus]